MPDETSPNRIPPGFKLRRVLRGHEAGINRIAWSPDGRTLASASLDRSVKLWDTESGALRRTLEGKGGVFWAVAWSPDGRMLVATAAEIVFVWDTGTWERGTIEWHIGAVYCVAWSPDGRMLATGSLDQSIGIWDAETFEPLQKLRGDFAVSALAWSPDGEELAAASGHSLSVWKTADWSVSFTVEGYHRKGIYALAYSPDDTELVTGSDDATIHVMLMEEEVTETFISFSLEGHMGKISWVGFSPDGRLMASKSMDNTVRLWRGITHAPVAVLEEETGEPRFQGLAFHPTEPLLATLGEEDTVIRIWELDVDLLLSALPEQEPVFYTTAKITLVGDSGAGKTGLGWRLAHGDFKEHSSTHGQQFWVIDELGATRADGTRCEAVLWDLAGQPDYRLVHALFLDDVDVALVLFDPTNRQEPLKGVEYWLKQLSRARRDGRKRRVILVGARADRGVPTLTREELEEFCARHGVEAYVGTSALTSEGLEDLMARVKSSIVWDEMPATVTTKTFKRVKEFVLSLKEEGGRRGVLVSPSELRERLEALDAEWEFTDAEMMTAVRHLSNHGYVAVLRGSAGEETILLAPDLLVNLASSLVLEARRNPRGLGALDEARVLAGGYEFPELAGLDEKERDVLLDAATVLFLEHNLCFRETLGEQTFLIFPALINQKRPVLEETETVDDVSYRVSGAVENVYAALVVQLGYTRNFTRTNQWQNQAEYETARGAVCGFRQVDEREGETELVLYYAKERQGAQLLFQGLFEEFLRGRDVAVTKFPPVQCPKCSYRQQRGEVVKRIGEGKGFLFCGECGKKIMLPKEGERVTLSRAEREQLNEDQRRTRRRTAFESALVRVKAVVRDEKKTAPSCFVSYAWGDAEHERWVRGLATDLQNAGIETVFDRKDNAEFGKNVARFISRITESDFVVVVGTPLYRLKYENKVSTTGNVVAAEVDLINLRLMATEAEKETVLPLIVEGDDRASLPTLMQGRVYGNFLDERFYFATLFDLILILYRIPFEHPAVSDLRESLRTDVARLR